MSKKSLQEIPEKLILDANILFSFFKMDSTRRHVFRELLKQDCELFSPEFVFEELLSIKERIKKFSCIDESEFSYLFDLLKKQITQSSEEEYKEFLQEANKLSLHEDARDDPYFALALRFNFPIWSDEVGFKKQNRVRIFSTQDLLELLSKESDKSDDVKEEEEREGEGEETAG